jgi:hypothetical protein
MRRRALAVVLALAGVAGVGCGSSSNEPAARADAELVAAEAPDAPADGGDALGVGAPSDASADFADTDGASDAADGSADSSREAFEHDGPISLDEFPALFAAGYCRRVYDCCLPEDRVVASPGDDEPMCVAGMTENARSNGETLLGISGIVYFPNGAQHCLEVLAGSPCSDIFDPATATLVACQDVFAGTLPVGTGCEGGRQCASGTCALETCAAPAVCAANEVVNDWNACVVRAGVGGSCTVTPQCPPNAACQGGTCTRRLADGAACQTFNDCAAACAPNAAGVDVCRPGYCTGP